MSTQSIIKRLDATILKRVQGSKRSVEVRHTRQLNVQVVKGLMLAMVALASLLLIVPVKGQVAAMPVACEAFAYSTEEDFETRGPMPPGGPIISDGDLLSDNGVVCARNADLVGPFDVSEAIDLGLDAADVIDAASFWVAFSTELSSPNVGQFTAGDLLIVHGSVTTVIPNVVLLNPFQVGYDIGLDGVHFVGEKDAIIKFLKSIEGRARDDWPDPGELTELLNDHQIDLWFSTEGTASIPGAPGFLDGDLLSASGTVIARNADLLPLGVPAGIPDRGVDFGLDAVASKRLVEKDNIRFSTEILYEDRVAFTDGDVLEYGTGVVVYTNWDLIDVFEPRARFLGLDALHLAPRPEEPFDFWVYLPLILRQWAGQ
jgi:hypothetical protein